MQSAAKPRRVESFRTLGACQCICHEVWKNVATRSVEPPGSSFSPLRTSCLRIPPSFSLSPPLLLSPSWVNCTSTQRWEQDVSESTVKVSPRACPREFSKLPEFTKSHEFGVETATLSPPPPLRTPYVLRCTWSFEWFASITVFRLRCWLDGGRLYSKFAYFYTSVNICGVRSSAGWKYQVGIFERYVCM